MTILNRFYASSGPELLLDTLEVQIGTSRLFLVKGWKNITATLETGETVEFEQCVMDVALPPRNADGSQDLRLAISNLSGRVSTEIRAAIKAKQKMLLIHRYYFDSDLNAPAKRRIRLTVKSGTWDQTTANITAGYLNILDYAFLRKRYTTGFAPGLRHM